jgi:hypothetical protein
MLANSSQDTPLTSLPLRRSQAQKGGAPVPISPFDLQVDLPLQPDREPSLVQSLSSTHQAPSPSWMGAEQPTPAMWQWGMTVVNPVQCVAAVKAWHHYVSRVEHTRSLATSGVQAKGTAKVLPHRATGEVLTYVSLQTAFAFTAMLSCFNSCLISSMHWEMYFA